MRALCWFVCLLTALASASCAERATRVRRGPGGKATSDALAIVDRQPPQTNVVQVGSLPQVDHILGYPRAAGSYHALGPDECQCLAARASKLGNLFDGERRALAANESAAGCCSHEDNSLTYDVLGTAALEARNRSAGDALDTYYQLAQNEARTHLLTRALGEARQAIGNVERLRQQGLKMPAGDDVFARREITLRDQQAQVLAGISRLNAQLWQLIGLWPATPQERILPTTDLTVAVEPVDIEAAVSLGLGMRPELGMLRRVRARLDDDSLGSARALLSQVSPLLGLAPQSSGDKGILGICSALKKLHAAERELPERRRQLNQYTTEREQEVAVEIRQAAETVELRLRQIALAKESLRGLSSRLADVESRSTTGRATFADVSLARLAAIEADEALLDKIVAWKIAQARLKQSQGLLVAECCP